MASKKPDIEVVLDTGINVNDKSIDISGEIDDDNIRRAIRGIRLLDKIKPDIELIVYLNSGGGDVYQGFALYDTIKQCQSTVKIIVVGECMSMAVWVLQAADIRVALPNSRFMLHEGSYSLPDNHHQNNVNWTKQYEKDKKIMEEMLVKKLGMNRRALRTLLRFDTLLTADQALKLKLIDEILE